MISYDIEHNLSQNALLKIQESIPPFIYYLNNIFEESNSIEELIDSVKETGYSCCERGNNLEIILLNRVNFHFKIIIKEIKTILRDKKLVQLLNE